MFLDIAPSEFLLTAVVAVVVIGPKDLPMALRTAGKSKDALARARESTLRALDRPIVRGAVVLP